VIGAVLDANAIVSATIVPVGYSGRLWQAAHVDRFEVVTSLPIITEVLHTLTHPRVRHKYDLSDEEIERVRYYLVHFTRLVAITQSVQGVATHPEDDLILATAVSGSADYFVTGDRQLLNLGTYQAVGIVTPRAFWELLERTAPAS